MKIPNNICGIPVRASRLLLVEGTPYPVRRTWRERLFSRPWQPLRSHRMVTPMVPDPKVYLFDAPNPISSKVVVGHPDTLSALKDLDLSYD